MSLYERSTDSRWRLHAPTVWPDWAIDWASTKGSLTERLVGLGRGFEVEPVWQGRCRLRAAEAVALGLPAGRSVDARLVRLSVGGQVVVVAKTIKMLDAPRCDWPFWRGLGRRSLGTALFSDPTVRRGRLQFSTLLAAIRWPNQLIDHAGPRYARVAKFTRAKATTPLWVCEVFLPSLSDVMVNQEKK